MGGSVFYKESRCRYLLSVIAIVLLAGCSSTKHLPEERYLLWKNKIDLSTDKVMVNKGEIKESLDHIIVQRPNSYFMGITFVKIPMKLWWYNLRYKRLHNRADSLLPKSVERPTILDTMTMSQSVQNMKAYLFNQGYFYAQIKDTVLYRRKKAYAIYKVNAGVNYLINRINFDIDDSGILSIVQASKRATILTKGKEFTYSLLEEERSRIAAVVANHGYRRFSLDNITFRIDTLDKSLFRIAASPFENAVNFIAQSKSNKKSTLDIDVVIRATDDTLAYNKYTISKMTVYPDYQGVEDRSDLGLKTYTINGIDFKYHSVYVRPKVLYQHIFLNPGGLYSKANEDKTTTKLGELGIFQFVRLQLRENRETRDSLTGDIYLNRAKKYDFSANYEVSNGNTYALGNSISVNYRNHNFLKGANLLTIGVSGGLESFYNEDISNEIYKRFRILTRYYGVNASLDFPKFLAPVASSLFTNSNLPHTIVSAGENVLDRVNYFRLVNTSLNYSYSWHQTDTKIWNLTPAFVNRIRLPERTDSFNKVLQDNEYLRNSYKETYIEGENISFRFDNSAKRKGVNYSYVRLAFEEAGGVLDGINKLGTVLSDLFALYDTAYAHYTKFDVDARHYFTMRRSMVAFRFYGGVGVPYGASSSLPYIKQYFSGGPYSLRGWRIRTLGPGSYRQDTGAKSLQLSQIDRTGDIKLELNGEYRFPIAPLFAGALKMNGAIFADAGNIWLTYADSSYVGGEFAFNKLGQDIAMDIGVGARFDIASFLTIRVDLAMPVKKPYMLSTGGWVYDEIDFSNPTWRKDNLILNLSIGYPF